ncbi:MAG: NAD-dependent epimerase/dehydratase family protein [Rhizobiales bacterium]|nr:NAD-dependent epimerase/dehydratase family protein [Hyphomicrobiales bacterium]
MAEKTALVVGATGVVGRNLLRHLVSLGGWRVIAVSRRKPDVEGEYRHLSVDLLDRAKTQEVLGRTLGITHVFYSAYVERPNAEDMVAPNVGMSRSLLNIAKRSLPRLTLRGVGLASKDAVG